MKKIVTKFINDCKYMTYWKKWGKSKGFVLLITFKKASKGKNTNKYRRISLYLYGSTYEPSKWCKVEQWLKNWNLCLRNFSTYNYTKLVVLFRKTEEVVNNEHIVVELGLIIHFRKKVKIEIICYSFYVLFLISCIL